MLLNSGLEKVLYSGPGLADFLNGKVTFNNSSPALRARIQASHLNLQCHLKVSWHSKLETQDSILTSQSLNNLSFEMQGSSLEDVRIDNYQVLMIEDLEAIGFYVKLFLFSKRTTLCSHIFAQSISAAVRCCVTVWIASFGKLSIRVNRYFRFWRFILHHCTVYVAFACHVPRFSRVNHQLRQASNGLKQENVRATCPMDKLQSLTELVETLIALKEPSKVFPT